MKEFWTRIRIYLRESAERKLMIGRMSVSRLTIFGVAAGILLAAVLALIYLTYGKRDTALTYARADVRGGYSYRMRDNLLSYRAENYLYTYDGERNVSTFYELGTIDGYDVSSSMAIAYSGSAFLIPGVQRNAQPKVLSNGTILDVRAGANYAAILFENPNGDRHILIVTRAMESVSTLSFKDGDVVAFDFVRSGASELLWVSTMDVKQFTEESIVRLYDCRNGGAMVHYTSAFYNQSIYNAYLSDTCLFLIGTQAIIRYDRDEDGGFSAERDRVRVYGSTIVDFSAGPESAYFIALPDAAEGGENNLVRLITVSETDYLWSTVMQKYMPAPVVGAFLHQNRVCVFTRENFLQFSFAGKKLLDVEQQYVPNAVFEYGDTGFLVLTDDACYRATVA